MPRTNYLKGLSTDYSMLPTAPWNSSWSAVPGWLNVQVLEREIGVPQLVQRIRVLDAFDCGAEERETRG